jgi:hypothetical protein
MHGHNRGYSPDEPMPWDEDDGMSTEPPPNPTALHRTSRSKNRPMYEAMREEAMEEAARMAAQRWDIHNSSNGALGAPAEGRPAHAARREKRPPNTSRTADPQ